MHLDDEQVYFQVESHDSEAHTYEKIESQKINRQPELFMSQNIEIPQVARHDYVRV